MAKSNIEIIDLNNYERVNPQSLLQIGNKYLTNGPDNNFFNLVEERYLGSPSLQAVIDNYCRYILGEGLIALEGITQEKLDSILSKKDLTRLVKEFKKHNNSPLQVIYNKAGELKVTRIHSYFARQVCVDRPKDMMDDPTAYWFSYDWKLRGRFRPQLIKSFKEGENRETEMYYLQGNSEQPFFSLPDYFSCLQYAKVEEEISNYYIKHIQNNFSAGKIVNINQGLALSEEAEEDAERTIKNKLTGTNAAGNLIVCFNNNKEDATTVEDIQIIDAYQQFTTLSEQANAKILLANKVTSPSLFGHNVATGFSSDSEQMKTALKTLYRSQINPLREEIIDGLEDILKIGYPDVKLGFKDFEELREVDENKNKEI